MIIKPEQSSHYYWPDGKPCYEVPNASKPGQMRKTTLADAKKLGLYPSPTTIMKILNNEVINNWRVNQALYHAMTTPSSEGESGDQYARRVSESMQDRKSVV